MPSSKIIKRAEAVSSTRWTVSPIATTGAAPAPTEATALIGEPTEPAIAPAEAAALAEALMADAERQAAQLLAVAQTEADNLRLTAEQAGYRAGRDAAGLEQAAHLARLRTLAATARREAGTQIAELESIVVDLSREIAAWWIGQVVDAHPDCLVDRVRDLLAEVDARLVVRIRLHPEDAAILRGVTADFQPSEFAHPIVEDETLQRGDCIIETTTGGLDAQFGSVFAKAIAETPGGLA